MCLTSIVVWLTKWKNKKSITLVILGLDNAGKSVTVRRLVGKDVSHTAPTVGFDQFTLETFGCRIRLYDLGGGKSIRDIWQLYFSEAHGLVYVLDAADEKRLEECKSALTMVLHDERLAGKPLLVLANKQDLEGAYDEMEICERLNLDALVTEQRCPTRIETCSILHHPMDASLRQGFRWLIDAIKKNYILLSERVSLDTRAQKAEEEKIAEERKRRITGRSNKVEDSEIATSATGNPFRSLSAVLRELDKEIDDSKQSPVKFLNNKVSPLSVDNNKASPLSVDNNKVSPLSVD